jgi:hypothetical protein
MAKTRQLRAQRLLYFVDFTGQGARKATAKFVAWVGATWARRAHPVSYLGEFNLSTQRLHLSAQLWAD